MTSQTLMTKSSINRSKTISGFTLVELLLVLVLIAITMAAIAPQLRGSIAAWQLRESSKNMLTAIRLARQFALTTQEITVFALDANNASFTVKRIDSSVDSDSPSNDLLVQRQFLDQSVKIVNVEGFEQIGREKSLVFWTDGRAKNAHLTLAADKNAGTTEWHISVKDDGSVSIEEVLRK
jgi:type II secretion system protein H